MRGIRATGFTHLGNELSQFINKLGAGLRRLGGFGIPTDCDTPHVGADLMSVADPFLPLFTVKNSFPRCVNPIGIRGRTNLGIHGRWVAAID